MVRALGKHFSKKGNANGRRVCYHFSPPPENARSFIIERLYSQRFLIREVLINYVMR